MTEKVGAFFIIVICSICYCCEDHSPRPKSIFIAQYPENKQAAISFTFDDGYPSGYNIIAPIFEQYGYRATFFVIAGNIRDGITWGTWRQLSEKGFEIGNHSFSHISFKGLYDTAIISREVNESYDLIERNIGKPPFAFAHPFHCTNPLVDAIIFTRHKASRLSPNGFCQWKNWYGEMGISKITKQIDEAIAQGQWYVPSAHGIRDGFAPLTSELLIQSLNYIKRNDSKIHIDTFENIARYVIERENTTLIINELENDKKFVELRSIVKDETLNCPLVVVFKNAPPSFSVTDIKGKSSLKRVGSDIFIYASPNASFEVSE
jgi:hypothetical protein